MGVMVAGTQDSWSHVILLRSRAREVGMCRMRENKKKKKQREMDAGAQFSFFFLGQGLAYGILLPTFRVCLASSANPSCKCLIHPLEVCFHHDYAF
jgi:hypothetical protein